MKLGLEIKILSRRHTNIIKKWKIPDIVRYHVEKKGLQSTIIDYVIEMKHPKSPLKCMRINITL